MTHLLIPPAPDVMECGCDEAGRGCLAGPVFAAAVILPGMFSHPRLNDSKQMSACDRKLLREIIEREAIAWSVASISPEEIDQINILNASIKAMHLAISGLGKSPDILLVDGNRFKPYGSIPHRCEIKGDGRFISIAAASVLAKTHRDEYMAKIHEEFPNYGWNSNKGYPTLEHRSAIRTHGITPYHRKSYRLLDGQLVISDW